jgi:membrane protease YdiL (CAAX protease family)
VVLTLVLLPIVLSLLTVYLWDNSRRLGELRRENTPANRLDFFRGKVIRQAVAILIVPAASLWVSGNFQLAMSPGATVLELRSQITNMTGVSAGDLAHYVSPRVMIEVAIAILLFEAIPLMLKSKRALVLGDVAILMPQNGWEASLCCVLALVAGTGEELLFRGFVPLALASFHIPLEIAFAVSVLIFGACHGYQGFVGVVTTCAAGAFLTGLYVLTGSLAVVMAVHVAIDGIGLVIRPLTGMALRQLVGRPL